MASVIVLAVVAAVLHSRKGHAVPITSSNTSVTQRAHGSCQQIDIPVTVSATNVEYDFPPVTNDIEARAFAVSTQKWSHPLSAWTVLKNVTVSGTYNIHAQLCVPKSPSSSKLQIMTHGIFYDSRYWDAPLNNYGNSYVEAALAEGYTTLAYDRLGVGLSDKGDAYTEVQAPLELNILHELTLGAKNGSLYKLSSVAASSPSPTEVVHVGHSFGSFLTQAYLGTYPNDTSGAILTGFIASSKATIIGASSAAVSYAPSQAGFSHLPEGYAALGDSGVQSLFMGGTYNSDNQAASSYTDEFLELAVTTAQPLPVGEYVSGFNTALKLFSLDLKAPVQYFVSENDFIVCAGDCKGAYNETTVKSAFPSSKDLEIYIQPNTGHASTLHNNATAAYGVMLDFLKRNGL